MQTSLAKRLLIDNGPAKAGALLGFLGFLAFSIPVVGVALVLGGITLWAFGWAKGIGEANLWSAGLLSSRRFPVAILFASLFGLVHYLEFQLVVIRLLLSNAVFLVGYTFFAAVGLLVFLPEEPIPHKPRRESVSGPLTFVVALLFAILLSKLNPMALFFALGFVGLFSGIGFRVAYWLVFQLRWSYCFKCEHGSWLLERNKKWYCNRKGHRVYVDGEGIPF